MAAKAGGSGVVVVVVVDVVGAVVLEEDVEVEVAAAVEELEQPARASAPASRSAAVRLPWRSRPSGARRRGARDGGKGRAGEQWAAPWAAEGRITREAYETAAPVRPPGAGASLAPSEQVCASQHGEEPVERLGVGE